MINQALDIGNTSNNGQYIFGGYQTDKKPFTLTDPNTVTYNGDANVMRRAIGPSQSVSQNIPGDFAFYPLFKSLIDARNSLQSNNTAALRTALGAIQSSLTIVGENRTSNGARQRQVQSTMDYLDKVSTEVKGLLTTKEDVNMAEAIMLLRGQETAYQSVIEVSQRAISAFNLFDYMR